MPQTHAVCSGAAMPAELSQRGRGANEMLRAGSPASTLTERRYKHLWSFLLFTWLLACLTASPLQAQYAIPGTIEAENYSAMAGVLTGMSSEGTAVGWLDAGDWMDYAINPSTAGTYTVALRVASPAGGGSVRILSGSTELAIVSVPVTGGWDSWTTVSSTLNLVAGIQTIRLEVASAGWNINWMSFAGPVFPWDNGSGSGNWNTSDTNWSGRAWTNGSGNPAGFTAVGGAINLSAIVASDVGFGAAWANIPNASFNGGSLQANSLTVQGMSSNTGGPNPTLTLNVPTVSVSGDMAVGRANLRMESGEVIANRLVTAAESPDYGTLALTGGTLRLTNGLDSSTNGPVPFSMNLRGGALYTPSIRVADWEQPNFGINVWSVLDGTVIHPTASSSNFITFYGTWQNIYLGNHASAATFSTDGFDITVAANLLASGTGGLSKQLAGTLTLAGRNTYSGTTAVQGGVLALANQAALGEGPLNISSGAKVALNFTGQSYVTQLTLGGAVQAAGTYGSSGSSATNKNDTWFSGTGVINVSASIDHVAMATSNLTASDAAWAAGDWVAVRSALSNVFNDLKLTAQWRSIAHLRYARSFQAAGDYTTASSVFAVIAETTDYPLLHKLEGTECKTECDRLALGLPGRDPVANRVAVPPALPAGRIYHVAANGSDGNPGTLGQPFATVGKALEVSRAAGPVAAGEEVLIQLASGRYELASTISLSSADSANGPLRIKAATAGGAIISGSKRLTGFTAVTDPSILARLPSEALGKVMQCSLSSLGITDASDLFVNGVKQPVARWPNLGFVPIAAMSDNGWPDRPQTFVYHGSRPSRWTTATDAWLHGYFHGSAYDDRVAIGSINPPAGSITTATCVRTWTGWPEMNAGAPYRAYNLLEEIDQPGEWYLDRTSNIVYWYPTADASTATVELSVQWASMLTADNASHLRVEGIVFDGSRGAGLQLNNCTDSLVTGCTLRNLGGGGVAFNGGQRNAMIGCDLVGLGGTSCHIEAGDRNTLVRGDTVVANCRFINFAVGMGLNGVGNRVTHCKFENSHTTAIWFKGSEHRVEYNEFRNVVNEGDDSGVIASWGNPTYRGNLWRFNRFAYCGGGYTQGGVTGWRYFGTNIFRFDDVISGQNVYGNIVDHHDVWGTLAGAMEANSGRDNVYDNNLILDSTSPNAGYHNAGNVMFRWWEKWGDPPSGLTPLYLAAYPELNRLYDGKGQNYMWRSLSLRCRQDGLPAYVENSDWKGWQYIGNTNTDTDPGFIDGSEVKKNIDPTVFWKLGMRAIPVNEIGLYADAARAGWMDKPEGGYWNGGAGSWNNASVNWSTSAGQAASSAWDRNTFTTAVFAGAGGTVNVAEPVAADGLVFETGGYTLAGTQPVILNGPETMIDQKSHGATINAQLTGLGGIAVAGTGTLTLGGISDYNGATAVRVGTLALVGGDNRLPKGTVLTLGDGGSVNVGVLKLNGCNQELTGLGTAGFDGYNGGLFAGDRLINGSATPSTLTLNIESGLNNQFVGTLGGPGQYDNNFAVKKTGGGTLWLGRSANWTGGTTIEEGALELSSVWWQGNEASGTFRIGKGATFAVSGVVSPLTFNAVTVEFLSGGAGTLTNRGSWDWLDWKANGGMTIRSTGGERNLFNAAPNYALVINWYDLLCDIARGSDATCDLLVSIPLGGYGGIIKQGNGIMTLSGGNSYNGATAVNGGTLLVDGSTASASAVTLVSGATVGGSGWIGGAITVPSGATIAPGSTAGATLTAGSSVTLGGRLAVAIDGAANNSLAVAGNLNIAGSTLGITVRAGGTGRSEYVLATFGNLVGSAFAAVEGLPAGYRLEYDLAGKQIRLVKIDVGISATSGAGGIDLTWASPEVGVTSYTVRRATTSGGPYTVIATDIAGTNYLDSAVVNGTTYYYTVQSSLGAFSDVASALFSVAVRNLAASPGFNTVGLSWTPVDVGTVTYTILRATSPGGAHTIIASGITANSYADNTAVNGTTYYYSVQSQSGAVSGEVSATPTGVAGALPPPWIQADAGTVGLAGNVTYTAGTFTSAGAGVGATGTADAFHFVYLPVVGDCTIIARVDSLGTGGTTSRRAGVMIRQSLNANAIEAATLLGTTAVYNTRRTTVGGTTSSSTSNTTPPRWVRLIRSGNTLTAAHSADGATWTSLTARTVTMTGTVYVGLVVSSGNTTALNTAVFSNVSITGGYPVGLTAVAGDRSVQLAWTAVTNAASYNIKRSTTNGGPYTTLGTATATSHTDTTAQNGTTYYYVVSAVSGTGESVNSVQVAATPGRVPANGILANASGGNWSAAANWLGGLIAGEIDKSATFNLAAGGTINQDLAGLTIGGLAFAIGSYTITGNALTLDVSSGKPLVSVGDGCTAIIAAALSGADGLAKSGAGRLTLSGANDYTGDTTIIAGTLQIGNGGTSGTLGSGIVTNNASLVFNRSDSLTVGNVINGTGSLAQSGSGTLTLSGENGYAGGTTVNSGFLLVDATGTLGSGNLSVASGASCEIRNIGGSVGNNAAVTLNGTATLNLASGVTETVGLLVIDGVEQVRGTWNATRDAVHFAGTGSLIVTAGPQSDADGVWTSLVGGVWSQTSNWQNGNVAKGADKTATFNQTPGTIVTVDVPQTIGNLTFATPGYSLVGSPLTLASASGTSTVAVANGSSAFIGSVLTGASHLNKTGDGTLILASANSYTGSTTVAAGILWVASETSARVTIPNAGFESPAFGANGWSYNPNGAGWNFDGAGIGRSGSPWVNIAPEGSQVGFVQGGGTLSQTLTVADGGFYDLTFKAANRPNYADSGIDVKIDGVTVKNHPAGSFASGAVFNTFTVHGIRLEAGSRVLSFTGIQNGGDSATAIDDVRLTYAASGSLPSGTALTLTGGTLRLDVAQTAGSLVGVSGAQIINNVAITVGDVADTTFAGLISGTGALVKTASGTLTLSGANNYTGLTNIYAGTLVAANHTALGVGGFRGDTMTFIRDGATLALQGGISLDEHFHVWGSGVGGLGAVRSTSGHNALTSSYLGGAGYNLRSSTTVGVDADSLTVTGFYEDGGSFSLTKVGAGTLTLTAPSTYTGGTMINGGTLVSGAGGVAKGAVSLASGATLSTTSASSTGLAALYYNHSASQANIASLPALLNHFGANITAPSLVQTARSMNFAGNGSGFPAPYNSAAANFEAFYSGKVNITTAGTYTFNTSSDDGSMLFIDGQAVVTNNFDQGVTTRTGSISLTAGMHDIVIAYNQGGGGYGMNAQMSGAGNTTMVDINTSNANITPDLVVGSLAGAGNVTLITGNLITGIDNSSTNFSGVISGIGSLTKFGSGTQTLTGANSYTGATTISAGTLQLGDGGTTGRLSTSSTITNNDNFIINRSNAVTQGTDFSASAIGGSGSLTQAGTGTTTLTAANSYTGSTTVSGGMLSLAFASLADSSSVIIAAGAMLHLNFTGTDAIRSLSVDGSPLPPGVYSSTSGFITGTGTLTVATGLPSTDYATWSGRGMHNLTEGPSSDDDGDGVANLLEYVLGGNPRTPSSGILPTATATAGNLVFTFRRVSATTADTTQTFQYGTNLSGWTDVPVVAGGMVAIQPNTPQPGTDTVTITVPEGTEPRIFGRLKVSVSPAQP